MSGRELLALDIERLSPTENARYVIALEEAIRREPGEREAAEESRRIWRCMMLARDLETFEALVAGHKVPESRLDRETLARALKGA